MAKKMSLFMRKRLGVKSVPDHRFAGLDTLSASRPIDEAPALDFMIDPRTRAMGSLITTREALANLLAHRIEPDDVTPFNEVASAIDVAHIRYIQIDPKDENPALQPMVDAKEALENVRQRWIKTGKWGVSGPDRQALAYAVELYAEVILASSQRQMATAAEERWAALCKGQTWAAAHPREHTKEVAA